MCEYIRSYKLKFTNNNTPIIVGHSFGGYLSSAFACQYPLLCKSIILVNSVGIFPILGSHGHFWDATSNTKVDIS